MAYKLDKPEANSDIRRIERWANLSVDLLIFALNDIDKRLDEISTQNVNPTDRSGLLQAKIDLLNEDISDLSDAIDNLSDTVSTLSDNYTTLEGRVSALEDN